MKLIQLNQKKIKERRRVLNDLNNHPKAGSYLTKYSQDM